MEFSAVTRQVSALISHGRTGTCGPLVNGPADAISVHTANGIITVPTQAISQVSPVGQCP